MPQKAAWSCQGATHSEIETFSPTASSYLMSVFIPEDPLQAPVSHNHLTLSTVAVLHFTFLRASIQRDSGTLAGIERLGRKRWITWQRRVRPVESVAGARLGDKGAFLSFQKKCMCVFRRHMVTHWVLIEDPVRRARPLEGDVGWSAHILGSSHSNSLLP